LVTIPFEELLEIKVPLALSPTSSEPEALFSGVRNVPRIRFARPEYSGA
jgi:hypothetical protein